MGREPMTLPRAGRRSSFTKSLAMDLCPWAGALWACLAFSLMKTQMFSRGQSGQRSTSAGNSTRRAHERSTVQMPCDSYQLLSQLKLSLIALSPTGVTGSARQSMHGSPRLLKSGHTVRSDLKCTRSMRAQSAGAFRPTRAQPLTVGQPC